MGKRSLIDIARYVLAGADDLSGGLAPTAAARELLADYERRAIARTRETILDELSAGRTAVVPASDDDGIAIVLRVYEAHRRGCARQALRLLIAVLNGLADHGPVYASEFARFEKVLSDLTREEIILLGTILKHYGVPKADDRARITADTLHRSVAADLVPRVFKTAEHMAAHWASAQRTGLLVGGTTFSTIGLAVPSPLLAEVAELSSFTDVLRREGMDV